MTPEFEPMDPALEQAVCEIRDDAVDPADIQAAADRVWARLAADMPAAAEHIRNCADFQALIPECRAGRLSKARALLLKDHLNECVACRHAFEGKVVAFPAPLAPVHHTAYTVRWAAAAVVVVAAGLSVWIAVDRQGTGAGRAMVQAVNGTLYQVSAVGILPLVAGQDLPDGVEIRTARDSSAVLLLRDGSTVELRERSGFSTSQSGADMTVSLNRGSVIVQAAKRSSGHLYVATTDCRVAVTGTVFSVNAGTKGSRISVIRGEVRVNQDNREKVLHPGDQTATTANLEPLPFTDELAWSQNRDRLLHGWNAASQTLRHPSPLLARVPASAVFYASIPNLAGYLTTAKAALARQLADNPELRQHLAGRIPDIGPVIDGLHAASEYLGGEIAIVGLAGSDGNAHAPVFFSEVKREGFREALEKTGVPLAVETRPGLAVFGPERDAVRAFAASLDAPAGGFNGSPCYAPLADSYRDGAGLLMCADLSRLSLEHTADAPRFLLVEEREVDHQMEDRASLGFGGPRTGMAAWLAAPAPMGSLDYVSPDATFVSAFVVRNPAAIVDEVLAVQQRSTAAAQKALTDFGRQAGFDVRDGLAASLGGEFALALDGAAFPVPSWKLVTEVYDPGRFQATLQKVVDVYNQTAAKSGGKPLRTGREIAEGRTWYMIGAAEPNPLTEAHYTFADGYLIAGPSRALVARALQVKAGRTSIARSAKFLAMAPRDHYANFSALMYQNLGSTLAPLAGLLGALGNNMRPGQKALPDLGNIKPSFLAAYGESDRITFATNGNTLGMSLSNMMNGSVLGMAGGGLPFAQMMGTPGHQPAFR